MHYSHLIYFKQKGHNPLFPHLTFWELTCSQQLFVIFFYIIFENGPDIIRTNEPVTLNIRQKSNMKNSSHNTAISGNLHPFGQTFQPTTLILKLGRISLNQIISNVDPRGIIWCYMPYTKLVSDEKMCKFCTTKYMCKENNLTLGGDNFDTRGMISTDKAEDQHTMFHAKDKPSVPHSLRDDFHSFHSKHIR